MVDGSKNSGMSKQEISALREALFAQQDLLQKLYTELDVEREAAASAASEALSMILRLQGEKAAIKMEMNQYKRLAEEKMCHSEEALAIFEDLIYQKEWEIASLEYQVQAYKYKLMSLGCTDIGFCETKFPENLLQLNESLSGEMGGMERNMRRNSLPPIPFKFSCQKRGKRERSLSPVVHLTMEEKRDIEIAEVEKKPEHTVSGDISSYWEEIKKLDERVKEISDFKARSKSPPIEIPQMGIEKDINTSSTSNVYDVFEVPIVHESEKVHETPEKLRLERGKSVSELAMKFDHTKDEKRPGRKRYFSKQREKTFSLRNEQEMVQYDNRTSERVEIGGSGSNYQERKDEEFKLLKEIKEQLNTIQGDIRSMKNEKRSSEYEQQLDSLSKEMLYFWF